MDGSGDHVDRAGPGGREAHRWTARHPRIGESHARRRDLVAHADQCDVQLLALAGQLDIGRAGYVENGLDAARLHGAGKQFTGTGQG